VSLGQTTLGELALQPARIYTAAVVDMLGGVDGEPQAVLHGVVHVTGGGLPGKLGRLLRRVALGAEITNAWPPGPLLAYLQEHGRVSDQEAYRVWNMGQGMLLITPQPDTVIALAAQHHIPAQIVGEVTSQPGIRVWSRGFFNTGNMPLMYQG
jgi:phosphoribosylformylglycinamidine cyclo-ligase